MVAGNRLNMVCSKNDHDSYYNKKISTWILKSISQETEKPYTDFFRLMNANKVHKYIRRKNHK